MVTSGHLTLIKDMGYVWSPYTDKHMITPHRDIVLGYLCLLHTDIDMGNIWSPYSNIDLGYLCNLTHR